MNYQLDRSDNLVIFHINDKKIEGDVSAKYKAQFLIFSQQPDLEAFVINIKDVESIDSAGFGAFLLAYRQLKENLIPVVITGANEYIKSLMSITQIEDLFEFYDTVEKALKVYNTPEQKDN